MHQAIPYRSWQPLISHTHFTVISPKDTTAATEGTTMVVKMVSENAVIVFARRGCCMSHVVKRLLLGLGVNPTVQEVDEKVEVGVIRELESIANDDGNKVQFPTVFIGGKLFGGLDRLMATHISGELVPILKQAGALWL